MSLLYVSSVESLQHLCWDLSLKPLRFVAPSRSEGMNQQKDINTSSSLCRREATWTSDSLNPFTEPIIVGRDWWRVTVTDGCASWVNEGPESQTLGWKTPSSLWWAEPFSTMRGWIWWSPPAAAGAWMSYTRPLVCGARSLSCSFSYN